MDIKQLYSGAEKEAFYPKVKLDSIEDKVNGKTLEQNLQDYNTKINNLNQKVFGTTSGASNNTSAIDTVPEVYSFLNGYANSTTLQAVINAIPTGGDTIIEQGSVVSVSGLQSSGASLGVITIDGNNNTIKISDDTIRNAIDYNNLSLDIRYDDTTHMLSLYKNGHLEKSIELPIDNQSYVQKPDSPSVFTATYNNASGLNNVAVNLQWSIVDGCDGYVIYRKVNDGEYSAIANISPDTVNHYIDDNITVGATYTYYIVSTLNSQASDPKYSDSVYAQLRVDVPTNVNAQYDSSNQRVIVSWSLGNEVTSYGIYRNNTRIGTVNGNSTSTYYDTNVTENTTYTYYVTAFINTTESNKSELVSVTTTPDQRVVINSIRFANEQDTSSGCYIQMYPTGNLVNSYVAEAYLPNDVPANTVVTFELNGITKTGTQVVASGSSYRSIAVFSANDFVPNYEDVSNPNPVTTRNHLTVRASYLGLTATMEKSYRVQYPIYCGFTNKTSGFGSSDLESLTVVNPDISDSAIYNRIISNPDSSETSERRLVIAIAANNGNPSGLVNAGLNIPVSLYTWSDHDRYSVTIGGIQYYFFLTNSEFYPINLTGNDRLRVKFVFNN